MQHNQLTEEEKRTGWRLLFDGKTLNGWGGNGEPIGWRVEDDSILCEGRGGSYLATDEQFEDYLLSLEFRIEPEGNSGVFIRWSDLADPVNTGLEIQILDSYGTEELKKNTCGAIYGLAAPTRHVFRPPGEWNHFLIRCDGPIVAVQQNGEWISEANIDEWTEPGKDPDGTPNKFTYAWKDVPRIGHIGLQPYSGQVWFRNVKIKPL